MLYLKTRPAGIDIPIQKLQKRLHSDLIKKWGIDERMYNAYGRAYKNQKENGLVPEIFKGNTEYTEAFINDKVSVTSFFVVDDVVKLSSQKKTPVSVIFCVNLNHLYKNVSHRADEEVHIDVIRLCNRFGFEVTDITTGTDRVFREFNKASVKYRDMHPFHCFRVELSIFYKEC